MRSLYQLASVPEKGPEHIEHTMIGVAIDTHYA